MNHPSLLRLIYAFCIAHFFLVGCDTPTRVAQPSPESTEVSVAPTATTELPTAIPTLAVPTFTQTSTPGSTLTLAPTPTRTLLPTSTSTPRPSFTRTSEPSFGIIVSGPDAFITQTQKALTFLNSCAPDALATVKQFITTIAHSSRSGMEVGQGSFFASDVTAFAPGYLPPAQVFWFAGSIVHDARHRWQSQQGTPTNWDTSLEQRQALEQDARAPQIAVLQKCLTSVPFSAQAQANFMLKYLTDMQNGITPCDYCAVEWANRNW